MTKKDYIKIAAVLRQCKPPFNYDDQETFERRGPWKLICTEMAQALASTNERFDYRRFLTACGYYDEDKQLMELGE